MARYLAATPEELTREGLHRLWEEVAVAAIRVYVAEMEAINQRSQALPYDHPQRKWAEGR